MKYLKTYEMRLGSTIPNNVEPEIIKLFDYLKMLVMGLKDTYWKDDELSGRINVECNKDDKEWKTYSIILNCYYYFIYQFDYKKKLQMRDSPSKKATKGLSFRVTTQFY